MTTDRTPDPLEELSDLMRAAPQPDEARRSATISAATENFSHTRQETAEAARPVRGIRAMGPGSIGREVIEMTKTMSGKLKAGLAGGAAVASMAVVAMILVGQQDMATGPETADVRVRGEMDASVSSNPAGAAEDSGPATEDLESAPTPSGSAPAPEIASDMATSPAQPLVAKPEMRMQAAPGAKQAVPSDGAGFMASRGAGGIAPDAPTALPQDRERYASGEISDTRVTSEEPVSTFSIDVDTASYALARSSLQAGRMPDPDSVRVEEIINYFDYDYPAPQAGGDPFSSSVATFETPWNDGTRLVRIGLQGWEVPAAERPPLDLVFLVDVSGSMRSSDKLGLLKQSLKMMLPELRPEDRVGIVTYAGAAGTALELTAASEVDEIEAALDGLAAGGSTAGAAGLRAAYAMAAEGDPEDRMGRVVLATDGDFNVGMSSVEDIKSFIEDEREDGAYLSVLGFGRGNLNDALMQTLAQNGNGQAAYIDTLSEARKVLSEQFAAATVPIADDVKIQVEFNPAAVAEYRLIGYETRALDREDFNNDAVDAGEIGSGHSVTALYEITPVGSDAILNDPLRYGTDAPVATAMPDEIGFLKMRYKRPGEDDSTLVTRPIANETVEPDDDARFAAAIAGFGQLLRGDDRLGDWSWGDAADLAATSRGEDRFGYRNEAVQLIQLAGVLDN